MKIDMKQPILDKNDAIARELCERFAEHHVYVVDLLASPGSGKTSTIFLKEPLPIFLMYLTANAENGQVRFMPDLYQRDQGILDALNGPPSLLEHTTQMPEFKSHSSISPEQGEKTS